MYKMVLLMTEQCTLKIGEHDPIKMWDYLQLRNLTQVYENHLRVTIPCEEKFAISMRYNPTKIAFEIAQSWPPGIFSLFSMTHFIKVHLPSKLEFFLSVHP